MLDYTMSTDAEDCGAILSLRTMKTGVIPITSYYTQYSGRQVGRYRHLGTANLCSDFDRISKGHSLHSSEAMQPPLSEALESTGLLALFPETSSWLFYHAGELGCMLDYRYKTSPSL